LINVGVVMLFVVFGAWKLEKIVNYKFGYAPLFEKRFEQLENRVKFLESKLD